MSESISWGELAELTHATQVEKFNFCTCEEQEEFPFADCPRTEKVVAKDLAEVETEQDLREWFAERFPNSTVTTDENNEIVVRLATVVDMGGLLYPVE